MELIPSKLRSDDLQGNNPPGSSRSWILKRDAAEKMRRIGQYVQCVSTFVLFY